MSTALIIDDSVFKSIKIRNILMDNGVKECILVENQEEAWQILKQKPIDLIVTDMHYPLRVYGDSDVKAGLKLIERIKKENIQIPVILCSSVNYQIPDILGCVWYSELTDMQKEFKELLKDI